MTITNVEYDKARFTLQYIDKGLILYKAISKEELWRYIVSRKFHIADAETEEMWEMEEFYDNCELIALEIAKIWFRRKMN